MTRTEEAIQALAAAIASPGVLPALRRDQFFEDVMAKDGERESALILRRGRTEVVERFMGDGVGQFELAHGAELEWFVCHADEAQMNAAFDAGLEAIAAAVSADPTLGGVVDDCIIDEPPVYDTQEWDARPCLSALITVRLQFVSANPF